MPKKPALTQGIMIDDYQGEVTSVRPREFSPKRHLWVASDGWYLRAYEIDSVHQLGSLYVFRMADGTTRSVYANTRIEVIERKGRQ